MSDRCPKCGTLNGPAVQVCRRCGELLVDLPDGASVPPASISPGLERAVRRDRRRRSSGIWPGVVTGLVIAAVVGWFLHRPQAGPVLAQAADRVASAAVAAPAAIVQSTPNPPPSAGEATVAPDAEAPGPSMAPVESAASAVDEAAARLERRRRADAAKARVLREQEAARAASAAEAERQRALDAAAKPVVVPPPVVEPAAAIAAPAPPPRPRTAQELCAGGRGDCLVRECAAPEHADETACRRLRDAEDRRRARGD